MFGLFLTFYKLYVDVRIWFKHCSRFALVNPKSFIVVLFNINGWTHKFNIIIWSLYHCSNNPFNWKTPSLLRTTIIQGTTLALSMVGCIRSLKSLTLATCQHGVEIYVWLALEVLWWMWLEWDFIWHCHHPWCSPTLTQCGH